MAEQGPAGELIAPFVRLPHRRIKSALKIRNAHPGAGDEERAKKPRWWRVMIGEQGHLIPPRKTHIAKTSSRLFSFKLQSFENDTSLRPDIHGGRSAPRRR